MFSYWHDHLSAVVYNICHNLFVAHVGHRRTKATLVETQYHKSPWQLSTSGRLCASAHWNNKFSCTHTMNLNMLEGIKKKNLLQERKRESWRGRKLLISKCASLDVVCYLIRHLIRHTWKTIGVELNIKVHYEIRTSSKTCSTCDTYSEVMKRLVIEIKSTGNKNSVVHWGSYL